MKKNGLYEELKKNPNNVHFNRLCGAAELFGFRFKGGKGSHRIYMRAGIREMLNFQNVGDRVAQKLPGIPELWLLCD